MIKDGDSVRSKQKKAEWFWGMLFAVIALGTILILWLGLDLITKALAVVGAVGLVFIGAVVLLGPFIPRSG